MQVDTVTIPARVVTTIELNESELTAAVVAWLISEGGNLGDDIQRRSEDTDFAVRFEGALWPFEVQVEYSKLPEVPPFRMPPAAPALPPVPALPGSAAWSPQTAVPPMPQPGLPPVMPGAFIFYLVEGSSKGLIAERKWLRADSDEQAIERFRNGFTATPPPPASFCKVLDRTNTRLPGMYVVNLDRSPS